MKRFCFCATFFLAPSLLFLVAIPVALNNQLGDSQTSDLSRDVFFAELDNNGNGNITIDELIGVRNAEKYVCINSVQFIEDTGGKSLDDEKEIQHAASNVLRSLHVGEGGGMSSSIQLTDLTKYWSSIGRLIAQSHT